jgi:phenylpyruvate tautomerase PptA (4-oxalocrotonate tautomerase family)
VIFSPAAQVRKRLDMPLVRISMSIGRSPEARRKMADAVHQALVETISIPAADRFQIITESQAGDFVYDPEYLNISRSSALIMIQIVISTGRSVDIKKALYRRIADLLSKEAAVRQEDVLINLVEVAKENWSFGNGVAQYAP